MKQRYKDEFNAWQMIFSKLTTMWRINKDSIDFKWGYFSPKFGLELALNRGGYFHQNYTINFCLLWGKFQVRLPFKTKREESCEWLTYGFNIFEDRFIFRWGEKYNSFQMPFVGYVFDHHLAMSKDGEWVDGSNSWDNKNIDRKEFSYQYQLSSGEIQNRTAKCFIEKRRWHRKWLPFLKMEVKQISVEFNDEVGEETGSWKGGCIGCSYEMKKGETMEQCLRRMEAERKF